MSEHDVIRTTIGVLLQAYEYDCRNYGPQDMHAWLMEQATVNLHANVEAVLLVLEDFPRTDPHQPHDAARAESEGDRDG